MFERSFMWTMRNGSRLLFAGAVMMVIAGVVTFMLNARVDLDWESLLFNLLYGYLTPAAYLLFGAVLTHRLRRDADPA